MRRRPLLVSRSAMLGLGLVAVLLVLVACTFWAQGTMPRAIAPAHTSPAGRDLFPQTQYRLDQAQGLLRIIAVLVFTIGVLLLSIYAHEIQTYRRRVVPDLRAHNAALVIANARLEALATTDPLTSLP